MNIQMNEFHGIGIYDTRIMDTFKVLIMEK